jgi:acetylornithine deacetylase/succinyl-diaminopimelate desuccinylase-like protein
MASGLLLGTTAAPTPPRTPPASAPQETLGQHAARILSEAIQIRTVNPPGDERPAAEFFTRQLAEAGVEAALVETPPGDSRVGRAAAWGRLRGTGKRRPLVLLSHLDVVPADSPAWEADPFGGVERDGFVIGRGALDAKGVAVVHLLSLAELARREHRLERDLIFLATPDEENGGRLGSGTLVREHPGLLHDAEYLLTEGGSVRLGADGKNPVWSVAVTEKSPCWLRVVATGTPGHSSAPPRDAAVSRLIGALDRVRRMEQPVLVVPEVQRMFKTLAPLAPPQDAEGYADLAASLWLDPEFRSRFLAERAHSALVRNTLAITVLEGASSTNTLPGEAAAHIDARLLPVERCDAFAAQVRETIGDARIRVETLLSFPSRNSPVDTPLYQAIRSVARATDPEAIVLPRMLVGFTDAHFFRDLGIVVYGFVPRWHRADETRGIHGPNERISIENLTRGVETLVAIIEELDRLDKTGTGLTIDFFAPTQAGPSPPRKNQ